MLWVSLLFALVTAAAAFGLDLWTSEQSYDGEGRPMPTRIGAAAVTFVLCWTFDWLVLFNSTPRFAGGGWVGFAILNLGIVLVVFGIANGVNMRVSAAPVVALVAMLVVGAGLGGIWQGWWYGQDNASTLAGLLKVEKEDVKAYPPTSDEHIVIVGAQAARFKASQAMNTQNIGTNFSLGADALQSVDGHMYYIFELVPSTWANARRVNYEVPGYVVVDAENPDTASQAKLGYHLRYYVGGTFDASLDRYLYTNGYWDQFVDNVTLEVDDKWNPIYTASINNAPVRWEHAVPTSFITVDPQTGKITEMGLDKIPSWVDRVYSSETAKQMLNWWGRWANAPYEKVESGNNRYKVSGDVDLVYTDQGPAWQALLTSYNSDTSVQFIALMDTKSNHVRLYTAPAGLITQDAVSRIFNTSAYGTKKFDPTNLALHKIYGQLTWVASLVPDGTGGAMNGDYPQAESFSGVGLMNATNSDAANAITQPSKGTAFDALNTQIANGSNNAAPNPESKKQTVQAKITSVDQVVLGGNTFVIFMLAGDNQHLYRGQIGTTFDSMSMGFAKVGTEVIVTYLDTGSQIRNISSYKDVALQPTGH